MSYGRNYLVDRVDTPFFVLCDDDIVITEHTNIEQMLRPLRNDTFDLVSAYFMNGDTRRGPHPEDSRTALG